MTDAVLAQVVYVSGDHLFLDSNNNCIFDATFIDQTSIVKVSETLGVLPIERAPFEGATVRVVDAVFSQSIAPQELGLLLRAKALSHWLSHFSNCISCGTQRGELMPDLGHQCQHCSHVQYPHISPCIIVLIEDGDYCVLAHHKRHGDRPIYSTLAGFVEAGESLEECIAREVKEESNLSIGKARYFESQSWPMPNQLMVGFHVDYDQGELLGCDEEIEDIRWFKYNQLPMVPPQHTIAGRLIQNFVQRRTLANAE